jgi:hypothetical protein
MERKTNVASTSGGVLFKKFLVVLCGLASSKRIVLTTTAPAVALVVDAIAKRSAEFEEKNMGNQ